MKFVLSCSIACLISFSTFTAVACSPEESRDKAWQLARTANQLAGQQLAHIERFANELQSISEEKPKQEWTNSCQVYDERLADFELAHERLIAANR